VSRAALIAVSLVALPFAVGDTWALTDEEIFRDFRFNLINPGARARGLGGAYLSLADDATAAQANPAGLGFLRRAEFFAELRSVDNAAQSSLIEESLPNGLDTFVATGTDLQDSTSFSFLSGVLSRNRWSLGFSRQELVNIDNTTLSSLAFTFEDTPGVFLVEGNGTIDVEVVNWNVSGGWRVTDRLGLGATLAYSRLDVSSRVTNTIVDTGQVVAPSEILAPTLDLETRIDDDDDDVTFAVGLLYREVGKWSVGAVYRRGPRFTVTEEIVSTQDRDDDGDPDGLDVFGVEEQFGASFSDRFSLPDTIAAGGSWNATDRLVVAADLERILYSNLLDGYTPGVNVLTSPDAEFVIDDATDVRAGVEYVLLNQGNSAPPMALRGGISSEESSTIRARSTGQGSFASEGVFREGGRQEHLMFGLGFIFKRYKLDMAADFSELSNEFLLSLIYQSKQ
jgi:long-subunit fatty acid transport protein